MKNSKLNDIVKNFLMNEGEKKQPSIKSRFLALEEMLSNVLGRSLSERRRLEVIKEQFSTLRRDVRRLEEKMVLLESENQELSEKLKILEESKEG